MTEMDSLDELTVNYEENGILKVKELEKTVLSKGAWVTVMFSYQEWSPKDEDYGPKKATIRRYKKVSGAYRQQSKFNISSGKQALMISQILGDWFKDTTDE